MKLIIITALVAVCQTAKLDRTYLPPPSAATAGGNHNSLQAPLIKTSGDQVFPPSDTPIGSYTNEYQGVVVDAAAPGTRASSDHFSGLGAPRPSYGSTDSKVGEAAFRGSGFQGQGNAGASDLKLERPQASKDRNSNILTYSNDVNPDAYSYGFETDNGIAVGENGIAANGIQAEGGYSYQGDDGQTYKVTYVADEMGYRPQGAHLPTPPPIPEEILKSLQQNAQEEAAGVVDDGSYDAQKYNEDYKHHNAADIAHNGPQLFGNRPESDASASGSLINQNNQDLGNRFGSPTDLHTAQFSQGNQFGVNTQQNGIQGFSGSQGSHGVPTSQFGQQTSQFGLTNDFNSHASQFGVQMQSTRPSGSPFGSHTQSNQLSHFGAQTQSLEASRPQFGSQVQSTQPFGSVQSQFGSQVQSAFSSGNKFGPQLQHSQSSGSQFGGQTQYKHQSGFPGSQFGSQFQSTQSSGTQFGIQGQTTRPSGSQLEAHNQVPNTHPFRPQFENPPQFDFQSKIQTKPQPEGSTDASASSSFSQSSVTPSPVSGNQFNGQNAHKPFDASSSNQFPSQNQQNNKFGASSSSSNINRFPQTPNRFGSTNEYLPPFNNVVSKPQFGSANSFYNRPSQNFDSQTQTQEFQQNSAFATPSKPNIFQSQTPSRPGQFSGNFQSSQSQQSPSQSSLNSQTISNTKPTSIPNTELTTPLEPNYVSTSSQPTHQSQATTNFGSSTPSFSGSKPNTGSSKPNFGGSTSGFGSSTSNFGSSSSTFGSSPPNFDSSKPSSDSAKFGSSSSTFGSPTSNFGGEKPSFGSTTSHGGFNKQPSNQFSQSQQFNTQENLSSGSQTFLSTVPDTRPQAPGIQSGGSVNKQGNNGRPQFQQNSFNQNQFNQKPDDSYYYNQPSKPFNVPQSSSFPSSPSYQSNVGQNSQIGSQQSSFTKVPGSPISSTSGTQLTQNQGSSTTFNGITQAAISPFPSVSPTLSTQFGTTQNSQLGSKPTFTQMTFSQSQSSTSQPSSSFPSRPQSQTTENGLSNSQTHSQKEPTVHNQQYDGTIYEYNKPAETVPSSQSDSDSSQTIQSNIVSSKPEVNRPTTSQISPKPTQVSNIIPNRFGQPTQFGSQTSSQYQSNSQAHTSSGSQPSQTNSIQGTIGLAQQPLGSTGSGYLGYPSAQDSKPQFGSNFGEISQYPTIGHPSIHQSNFNTIRDNQKGQNTNDQNLGLNLKPQVFQNQFGHDSQSAQTVTTQTDFPPELVSAFQNQAILSSMSPYQKEIFKKQQAAQAQVVLSSQSENKPSQPQQHTQFSHQIEQSTVESDSKPFADTAVLSVVPSPTSKQFLPETSAQAVVSSEPLDFLPLSTPQNQFRQPTSPQPTQPSRFPSFQGSSVQGISGKGEEFGGPRQPPSFDEKTGYHY